MTYKTSTSRKIATGIGCVVLATGLLFLAPGLLLGLALASSSERIIYSRAESPDGSREARVQFHDCGALCGFEKNVYVRHTWLSSDSSWFSCRAFWGDGPESVHLEWINEDHLVVHHGFATERVRDAAGSCGAVSITVRYDPTLSEDEV